MKVELSCKYETGHEVKMENGAVLKMIGKYKDGKSKSVCLTCIEKDPELWGMMRDRQTKDIRCGHSSCGCSNSIVYSSLQLKILKLRYNKKNIGKYEIKSDPLQGSSNVVCHCTLHSANHDIMFLGVVNNKTHPCKICGKLSIANARYESRGWILGGKALSDADYPTSIHKYNESGVRYLFWTCPYYKIWKGMVSRCYGEKDLIKSPYYKGTTVCDNWLVFSNFKLWMEQQDYKGMHLDKDLLQIGVDAKVYSPDTCLFIEDSINSFFTRSRNKSFITGANWDKQVSKYIAKGFYKGKHFNLGRYKTQEEAHYHWQKWKMGVLKEIIDGQSRPDTVLALNKALDKLKYEHENKIITAWL
tara:strand:- start:12929 stop:14005 length:1077 start_codon:yes stop_codon:yes gene_type:complete